MNPGDSVSRLKPCKCLLLFIWVFFRARGMAGENGTKEGNPFSGGVFFLLRAAEAWRQSSRVLPMKFGSSGPNPFRESFLEEEPAVEGHSAEDIYFFSVVEGLIGGGCFGEGEEMFERF